MLSSLAMALKLECRRVQCQEYNKVRLAKRVHVGLGAPLSAEGYPQLVGSQKDSSKVPMAIGN